MNNRSLIGIAMLAFALSGCGETGTESATPPGKSEPTQATTPASEQEKETAESVEDVEMRDSHWRLVALGGEPVNPPGGGGMAPRLRLQPDGQVSGFGGCNQFRGEYQLEGEKLTLGPIASTKMACPQIGDMEKRYFSSLSDAAGYGIEEGELLLMDAEGNELARLALIPGAGD